jgi:hypothetical protein
LNAYSDNAALCCFNILPLIIMNTRHGSRWSTHQYIGSTLSEIGRINWKFNLLADVTVVEGLSQDCGDRGAWCNMASRTPGSERCFFRRDRLPGTQEIDLTGGTKFILASVSMLTSMRCSRNTGLFKSCASCFCSGAAASRNPWAAFSNARLTSTSCQSSVRSHCCVKPARWIELIDLLHN